MFGYRQRNTRCVVVDIALVILSYSKSFMDTARAATASGCHTGLAPLGAVGLIIMLLVGGCRTYGHRGNEEMVYQQMEAVVNDLEQELSRAQAAGRTLEEALGDAPDVQAYVERYEDLVDMHEVLLQQQTERLEKHRGSDDYRDLNRSFRAMMSEQRALAMRYASLLERAQGGPVQGQERAPTPRGLGVGEPIGTYFYVPPYYRRIQNNRSAQAGLSPTAPSMDSLEARRPSADTTGGS